MAKQPAPYIQPVNMVLDLSTMQPTLDHEGNLTITLPMVVGSPFTQDYVDMVFKAMGQRMGEIALDNAAHTVNCAMVAKALSEKMR